MEIDYFCALSILIVFWYISSHLSRTRFLLILLPYSLLCKYKLYLQVARCCSKEMFCIFAINGTLVWQIYTMNMDTTIKDISIKSMLVVILCNSCLLKIIRKEDHYVKHECTNDLLKKNNGIFTEDIFQKAKGRCYPVYDIIIIAWFTYKICLYMSVTQIGFTIAEMRNSTVSIPYCQGGE